MEFPQLNKYESLVEKHLKHSLDHQVYSRSSQLQNQHINQLLNNLEQINIQRSYETNQLQEHKLTPQSNKSSEETLDLDLQRTFRSEKSTGSKSSRSLIFGQQKFNKNKEPSPWHLIHIYYFDLPICKAIPFDDTTKISDLIETAIEAYLNDAKLDHSKTKQRQYQYYQMRVPIHKGDYKADMKIPSINHHRFVAENIFDCLVLQAKDQHKSAKTEPIQFINKNIKKNTITIELYNEQNEKLGILQMLCSDSLQKIFKFIESNDFHNMDSYYLTQNKKDTEGLPWDFEIQHLQSNKLYIKSRKYIDQCEWQSKMQSLRLSISKESEPLIKLPIGLSQASQYEEFSVIKVNTMGFQQERILGIDQTKIYNYDKSFKQQKGQPSFFSKLFGLSEETGTKKPYRLISDILEIRKTYKGLIITYKEKSITYLMSEEEAKDRIFRKLNFLVQYSREQKSSIRAAIKH